VASFIFDRVLIMTNFGVERVRNVIHSWFETSCLLSNNFEARDRPIA